MGKFEKPRGPQGGPPKKDKPTTAEKKQAGGRPGGARKAVLICGAVALALVIGFFGYAAAVTKSGNIFPGVSVAGVNVGGMSRDEAKAAVDEAASSLYGSSSLTVKLPDRELTFGPDEMKISLDSGRAVQDAWEYGRDEGIFRALKMRLGGGAGEHFVDISDSLSMDMESVRSAVQGVADEIASVRKDSTYDLAADKHAVAIHVGTSRRSLDVDGLCDAAQTAVMMGDFSPLEYGYDEEPYTPVDLAALHDELCTDMADAYYDIKTKTIVDEVVGYGFDLAAAQQQQAMAKEGADLTVTLQPIEPETTRAELEEKLFHDVLGKYDSPHVNNANRTNNLELACKAINGTILNPGDTFSFNDTVGERTAAKGYLPATVYVSGESKPELGGGVCQVASTIYMATLLADLEVVERTEHMFAVTYVPMGMDATIYWGSLDYKFKNTTDYPLRIDATLSGGYVHIALVGTKTATTTVKMTYAVLSTIPWQDVQEVDASQPASYRQVTVTPYTGYKVQTYKQYLDADGNPVSETEKVAYSNYRKRDRVTTVGKQTETTPPETQPPETTPPATTAPATTTPTETAPPETTTPLFTQPETQGE